MKESRYAIELTGLDGSNPLAFLAALGVLRMAGQGARLHWLRNLRPVLAVPEILKSSDLYLRIANELRRAKSILDSYPQPAEVIKVAAAQYSSFARDELSDAASYQFAACFGSDAVRDKTDPTLVAPTRLSLANGNGGKKLILNFRQMIDAASLQPSTVRTRKGAKTDPKPTLEKLIEEAVIEWRRRDGKEFYSFRWDPLELRRAAHMANSPDSDPYSPVAGANLLALIGLTLLPSAPATKGLATACLFHRDHHELFAWPLWDAALDTKVVTSLLVTPGLGDSFAPNWNSDRGIFARFAVERYSDPQKNAYFNTSTSI